MDRDLPQNEKLRDGIKDACAKKMCVKNAETDFASDYKHRRSEGKPEVSPRRAKGEVGAF